jgi:hypothetical protein
MGLFDKLRGKKKHSDSEVLDTVGEIKTHLRATSYPVKVLVAWGEAIDGKKNLRDWLAKNGYPELAVFCFALKNETSAQDWLVKNGYPQFVALIKAIEGEKSAREWLLKYNFEILFHIAAAADGDISSKRFLLNTDRVYAGLANKMGRVKDDIDWSNNSIHQINP